MKIIYRITESILQIGG